MLVRISICTHTFAHGDLVCNGIIVLISKQPKVWIHSMISAMRLVNKCNHLMSYLHVHHFHPDVLDFRLPSFSIEGFDDHSVGITLVSSSTGAHIISTTDKSFW